MTEQEFLEAMASAAHQCWADWQEYCHSKGIRLADGGILVPPIAIERWERQISLPYAELREDEKQSDRDVVAKYYLPIIFAYIESHLPSALPSDKELRDCDRKTVAALRRGLAMRGHRLADCPTCGGNGFVPLGAEDDFGTTICETCHGEQRIVVPA